MAMSNSNGNDRNSDTAMVMMATVMTAITMKAMTMTATATMLARTKQWQ